MYSLWKKKNYSSITKKKPSSNAEDISLADGGLEIKKTIFFEDLLSLVSMI
jgi:hypothetical protein